MTIKLKAPLSCAQLYKLLRDEYLSAGSYIEVRKIGWTSYIIFLPTLDDYNVICIPCGVDMSSPVNSISASIMSTRDTRELMQQLGRLPVQNGASLKGFYQIVQSPERRQAKQLVEATNIELKDILTRLGF